LNSQSILSCIVLALLALPAVAHGADEFELAPIKYSEAQPSNSVTELQKRIARGETQLQYDKQFGYLPALLESLNIPHESQMLVYSKTSMQRDRISPRTPRAIYFNDDTYAGYCHLGEKIEVAAADPQLGAVFYTIEQQPQHDSKAGLTRQTQSCLQCHATRQDGSIPGLLARSVFVTRSGLPILSEGSHRVDHTTPIKDRWGGWYVTGTHGEQPHLGNLVIMSHNDSRPFNNDEGLNVVDLTDRLTTDNYLSAHSDIVALMVFEHQLHVHNLLTAANFEARRALFYEAELNRALGEPETNRLESTTRRIKNFGDKLLAGLLFSGEASITSPITGTSSFRETFSAAGPRDSQGRSLRDFDLQTRMFKYPCSYLIYSPAFDGLPVVMKTYITTRLREVLEGTDGDAAFSHLSAEDRLAILKILQETKPDLWLN
jgi:hypothetical protein